MTASPAFASAPVPTISSLVTSFVGAGPLGGVTCGSLDSGPLVGVFADAVVLVLVELVGGALLLASALSALFSLPTVIVLGAAGAAAGDQDGAPSAARPRQMRGCGLAGAGGVVHR